MRMRMMAAGLALAASLLALPAPAQQEAPEARLRDALRKTTQELRDLQDRQATQAAALQQAQAQRDQLQSQVDQLTARVQQLEQLRGVAELAAAQEQEIIRLQQGVQTLQTNSDQLQVALKKWQDAYQEAIGVARAKEGERAQLEGRLGRATQTLELCEQKNAQLAAVAGEILGLYQNEGFLSVWRGSFEPMFGLKRVELENILQDYQEKILDERFYRPQAQASQ